MLPVNELFETMQGEATWTGTPAVFLRLQGCDVGCGWCDTKHTWELDPAQRGNMQGVATKKADSAVWCNVDARMLADSIRDRFTARHVVLTGGEPAMHADIAKFLRRLHDLGYRTQIETSGTYELPAALVPMETWVTVSPKINMPGGRTVQRQALVRANEVKMPIGKQADIDALLQLVRANNIAQERVWLQPISQSAKATALCIDAATQNGWRVSIQTHKFLGVR